MNRTKKMTIYTVTIFLLSVGLGMFIDNLSDPSNEEIAFSMDWACMDGCYEMLYVIYGDVEYENIEQENYHRECSDRCFDKHLAKYINVKEGLK